MRRSDGHVSQQEAEGGSFALRAGLKTTCCTGIFSGAEL